jgi:PKD repeat protein
MKNIKIIIIIAVLLLAGALLSDEARSRAGEDERIMPLAARGKDLPVFSDEEAYADKAAAATITIAKEPNHLYDERTNVRFHPSGAVYVVFNDNNQATGKRSILLYKYEGGKVSFVKNVSESNLMAYEPDLAIGSDGWIHVAWAEGADANADTQHIKYRYFNGSSWSAITTLRTQTITGIAPGHNEEKIDDLRLDVDGNHNVFVVNMIWPAGRCQSLSRYGNQVYIETFPASGRTKHASVSVDPNTVHVAWMGLIGNEYYICYARRNNTPNSPWNTIQNVQGSAGGTVDRPYVRVNSQRVPHLTYLKTTSDGEGRHIYHRSWAGTAFSSAYQVSSQVKTYHAPRIATLDNNNVIIAAQTWAGGAKNYYNWKKNGKWGGFTYLNSSSNSDSCIDCALHANGQAAIAWAAGTSCSLVVFQSSGTPIPPDPDPDPIANVPPTASFSFTPQSGIYPLNVTFNAGSSKDSDGTIVNYAWDFGDGAVGSGQVVHHVYTRENRFEVTLTVTDNLGASDSATGELEVFGVAPPLNLQYQRFENRNLFSIEYLYRLAWNHNPRNDQIGAKIAYYNIYRREIGQGGFALFHTLQAGNLSAFEYLDRTLGSAARVFEYAVSSVDTTGRESTWAQLP